MMSKTVFLFIASVGLLAAADPAKLTGKLKSVHMDQSRDTLEYKYDGQGQVSSAETSRGYFTSYTYSGNTIIANTKGGSLVTMYLNSRGLVDSLTDVDTNRKITSTPQEGFPDNETMSLGAARAFPYSGNHTLAMTEIAGVTTHSIITISKKFSYDGEGYIKSETVYLKGRGNSLRQITASAVVEGGNIVSYSVRYPIDTVQIRNPRTGEFETKIVRQGDFIVKNTFDKDRMNTLAMDPFFGKSSKNLIVCSVKYDLTTGLPADTNVTSFQYSYDGRGRVSSLITAVRTNDPPEEKVYSERPDSCWFRYYP